MRHHPKIIPFGPLLWKLSGGDFVTAQWKKRRRKCYLCGKYWMRLCSFGWWMSLVRLGVEWGLVKLVKSLEVSLQLPLHNKMKLQQKLCWCVCECVCVSWKHTYNFQLFHCLLTYMHPSGLLHLYQPQILQGKDSRGIVARPQQVFDFFYNTIFHQCKTWAELWEKKLIRSSVSVKKLSEQWLYVRNNSFDCVRSQAKK